MLIMLQLYQIFQYISFVTLLLASLAQILGQIETRISDYDRSCLALLEEYANQTSSFTKCFIQHARPITVCLGCVHHYENVVSSYENIMRLKGDIPGEICKTELVNVDRLEVIVDSFKFVSLQWEKAMCSKCFESNSSALNRKTKDILTYQNATKTCIEQNNQTSHAKEQICNNCSESYFKLNDFYDNQGSYSEFCMDIIDAMNSSRLLWSITLGCCADRMKSDIFFAVTLTIILLSPVLFYLSVWIRSRAVLPEITSQRWTRQFHRLSVNTS